MNSEAADFLKWVNQPWHRRRTMMDILALQNKLFTVFSNQATALAGVAERPVIVKWSNSMVRTSGDEMKGAEPVNENLSYDRTNI